jgi:hypothetical protein
MGQPSLHEGRLWLDQQNNPWFGVQVTAGYQISAEVKLTTQFGDAPDPDPVYFIIDYRGAKTAPKVTNTGHGVTVDWENNSEEVVYLRISIGYEPPDQPLSEDYRSASRKCHISLATPKFPASNPSATHAMDSTARTGSMGETGDLTGTHATLGTHETSVIQTTDQLTEWLGELKFDIAQFLDLTHPGTPGGDSWSASSITNLDDLSLFFHSNSGWEEAANQLWNTAHSQITLGSKSAGVKIPMGMYILGQRSKP